MPIFSRDSRQGTSGKRQSGSRGTWNRAGAGKPAPREMHDATCSECGNRCQVPFFPSEGRPVKCRDCFRVDGPQFEGRDDRRPSYGDRKPFERRGRYTPREQSGGNDVEVRLRSIERKLDNLLELLDADEE